MRKTPLLGAHMSIDGGIHTAFERGMRVGCTTMQVFVKNNNQWSARPLSGTDIASYKTAEAKATIAPVVAHAAYLINLCSTNRSVLARSRAALVDELQRCEVLGIKALIVHPGSHGGAGEEAGIQRIAESLNICHERTKGLRVFTALETTAGQGTAVGYRFEHLRAILDLVENPARMRVCIDTCHLFAAGYPIHTESGWTSTMEEFAATIGVERLVAVHTNDSKKELGSRVDRHEHIGKGRIGRTCFRMLMNDPRLHSIPKILETPKGEDMREDRRNLRYLRLLVQKEVR